MGTKRRVRDGYLFMELNLSYVSHFFTLLRFLRRDVLIEVVFCGRDLQLISVISLLSQEVPDCNSPANVDAAVSNYLSLSHISIFR